jgi:hypothetical protein
MTDPAAPPPASGPRRFRLSKPLLVRLGVGLVLGAALALAVASRGKPVPPAQGGTLVFSDDFNRAEVGDAWQRQATADQGYEPGTWKIEDGRLKADKIHNAALWLKQALPENVRIEFVARAQSADGDVKAEVFGDGRNHQSGYILIHGGWRNTVNAIARQDEHGEDRKEDSRCGAGPERRCVEPDVDYQWAIERTDGVVRWYLDGALFLTFDDQHPIRGKHFGFNNWEAPVTFDDLRIFDLGAR